MLCLKKLKWVVLPSPAISCAVGRVTGRTCSQLLPALGSFLLQQNTLQTNWTRDTWNAVGRAAHFGGTGVHSQLFCIFVKPNFTNCTYNVRRISALRVN